MPLRPRILIVEDDIEIREALTECLDMEGFDVTTAGNGAEGLERLAEGPLPEAVLLDLVMPVLDGAGTLARIRSHPEWSKIPVIVSSADPLAPAVAADAARYLQKPYGIADAVAALRATLTAPDRA
jgi:CheY-like chemotaxis protein